MSSDASGEPSSDEAATDEAATDEVEALDPLALLRETLGHDRDSDALLTDLLRARLAYEVGDNQRALSLLDELAEKRQPSAELRAEIDALRRRIRPDRVALSVLLACVLGVIVVWFLAVGAY